MKTNFHKTIGQITFTLVTMFALAALAHAQGGIPLWTNIYHGPVTNIQEAAQAIAVDASGNVIVTGYSVGIGTGPDYATIKYSSAGVPLWTNRYDDPGGYVEYPVNVALDTNGNVFVTGTSHGGDRISTLKYSSAGMALWTNRYNILDGAGAKPYAIVVDRSGDVIVAGWVNTQGYPNYALDSVVLKYSNGGVPLWTNRLPYGAAVAVASDNSGNVFVTGSANNVGSIDCATIKYSSAGVPVWTNRYSGPADENRSAQDIAIDNNGDVIVTGSLTHGFSFTNADYVTIKYSNAGIPLWTNFYNGPENYDDYANAITVDTRNNVFVTGSSSFDSGYTDYATVAYSSAGVPLWTNRCDCRANPTAIAVNSHGTVFVTGSPATVAYSNAGLPLWTNFTGSPKIILYALAVDANGNVFVAGERCSGDCNSGDDDYVTIKYSPTFVPIHLDIERDGSGGLFIRYTGTPDVTYRLQRAASVTGPWSNLATNTAPASGLIEYHETTPPPGQAFYRTVQP